MTTFRVHPAESWGGRARVPGDKSVTHRALLLGAIAEGTTTIAHPGPGEDNAATVRCLRALGVAIEDPAEGPWTVEGVGLRGLRPPDSTLDCANSGTTVRLLAGLLAGAGVEAVLEGDESLRARPMARVVEPLRDLGWSVTCEEGRLPIRVAASAPRSEGPEAGERVVLRKASAQVKSALLLSALYRDRPLEIVEPSTSRDHTERMLRAMGGRCVSSPHYLGSGGDPDVVPWCRWVPGGVLRGRSLEVPGDLSSAAFLLAAAAMGGNGVELPDVGLNPGRTGFLEALVEMGATPVLHHRRVLSSGEPVGTIELQARPLRGIRLSGSTIPRLIDEIPVLAVLGAAAEGRFEVADAAELRVKESDRIHTTVRLLRALGVEVDEREDGFVFEGLGRPAWTGFRFDAEGDHRLAMAAAVAGMVASSPSIVEGASAAVVSWPGFWQTLLSLGVKVEALPHR